MFEDFIRENIRRELKGLPVAYTESKDQLNICAQGETEAQTKERAQLHLEAVAIENSLLDHSTQIIVATESNVDGLHKIRVLVPESKYHIFNGANESDFDFAGAKTKVTTIGEFLK